MKKIFKITILLTLTVGLAVTGCSSSKKGQCGCPNKQGMVGY
jgi:hypothetical protein